MEQQPEYATLAVTEAANRGCPHRDGCTPAILAYSASHSNSIYHSKPFQSLSHIFPSGRRFHLEGLTGVGTVRCQVRVCVSVVWINKKIYIYIFLSNLKEALVSLENRLEGGSQYPTALDLKPYLQKH